MLKRNDGYALSYVLVVLLVLCLIATAIMAPPLRNLQMQQASILRMQDKYAAQGLIEQVVAQLENGAESLTQENCTIKIEDTTYTIVTKTVPAITAELQVTETNGKKTVTYISYGISYDTEVTP